MADKMGKVASPQQNLQSALARVFLDYQAMKRVLHAHCTDRWAVLLNDARKTTKDKTSADELARELLANLQDGSPAAIDKCVEVLGRLTTAKNLS